MLMAIMESHDPNPLFSSAPYLAYLPVHAYSLLCMTPKLKPDMPATSCVVN